jgi:hypothetical protein
MAKKLYGKFVEYRIRTHSNGSVLNFIQYSIINKSLILINEKASPKTGKAYFLREC